MCFAVQFVVITGCTVFFLMLRGSCSPFRPFRPSLCSLLFALCSLLFALCSLLFALSSLLFALCSLLFPLT